MTSFKQVEANRANAQKSTGPVTPEGKQRSRCNALRHGLTAEVVIGALEDADDYGAFEQVIITGYDAQSAVERELVRRLAGVLWRLRRATTMETGLFEIQADHLSALRRARQGGPGSQEALYALFGRSMPARSSGRHLLTTLRASRATCPVRRRQPQAANSIPAWSLRAASYAWPTSPTSHSTASAAMNLRCGAKPAKSCPRSTTSIAANQTSEGAYLLADTRTLTDLSATFCGVPDRMRSREHRAENWLRFVKASKPNSPEVCRARRAGWLLHSCRH